MGRVIASKLAADGLDVAVAYVGSKDPDGHGPQTYGIPALGRAATYAVTWAGHIGPVHANGSLGDVMPSDKATRAGAPKRSSQGTRRQLDKHETEHATSRGMPLPALPRVNVAMPGGLAGNVIWLGGLATVAALGVVDWPVVALVAAGTWVAEQHIRQYQRSLPART